MSSANWKPSRGAVLAKRVGVWGLAFVMLAWPLSLLGGFTCILPGGFRASLYGGSTNFCRVLPREPEFPPGVYTFANPGAMWLRPSWTTLSAGAFSRSMLIIPLWLPALPLAIVAFVGIRRCRPPRTGLCRACDYDLCGTPDGARCPECGALVHPLSDD